MCLNHIPGQRGYRIIGCGLRPQRHYNLISYLIYVVTLYMQLENQNKRISKSPIVIETTWALGH